MNKSYQTLFLFLFLSGCGSHRTILDPPLSQSSGFEETEPDEPELLESDEVADLAPSGNFFEQELPTAGPLQLAALKQEAESWIGTPYRLGGKSRRGIDCSALVQEIFGILSLELPRTVAELYEMGTPAKREKLRVGDLVFFRFKGNAGPTHVGVYLGGGSFVHCSVEKGVRKDELRNKAYGDHFYGCRRILS